MPKVIKQLTNKVLSQQLQCKKQFSRLQLPKRILGITNERMTYLWEKCDLIDFVFYHTNFSMNQGNKAAIRSTLSGVATSVPVINPSCKPIGRIFFVVDGVNEEEADIFFTPECTYYVFLDNGTYAFANQMTDAGFAFYKNVFEQVSTQGAGQ